MKKKNSSKSTSSTDNGKNTSGRARTRRSAVLTGSSSSTTTEFRATASTTTESRATASNKSKASLFGKARLAEWRKGFARLREQLHKKGRQRLTIMVIPHTEKQILNFHLSVYGISAIIATVSAVTILSIVSLVGKSGEDLTHYGMGLDNKQFKLQSLKMAAEMVPLHEIITQYSNTIGHIHVKLDGNLNEVAARGGESQAIVDAEITRLKELMILCKDQGEKCDQDMTKEILRRVIYLSKQDNENLKYSILLSERIIKDLKSREKQNLIKHTPSIWPTRGYLLTPYGKHANQLIGRELFRRGIEIGALPGTEVYATAPGTVAGVVWDRYYGLRIKIKHRYGMRTYYSHLNQASVKRGERVAKGQVIGYVGQTGNVSIPMLYYEVHVGTVAYNPHAFLNHLQDQWLIQP